MTQDDRWRAVVNMLTNLREFLDWMSFSRMIAHTFAFTLLKISRTLISVLYHMYVSS